MASEDLLKKAVAAFKALSPEQQAEMLEEQRQSWVRGNVGLSRDERGMTSPVMPRPAPADLKARDRKHYKLIRKSLQNKGMLSAATDTGLVTVAHQYRWGGDPKWRYFGPIFADEPRETRALCDRSQAEGLLAAERAEKEEARRAEEEAKDCFWSIYETYLEKGGLPVSTEGARSALSNRIASLEADNAAKDAEIERLQKINAMIMGDDENAPRYTTKRLKQEVERVTQVMRGEASDRQAHVEALEAKLSTAETFIKLCADGAFVNDPRLRGAARAVLRERE
ncbi:hypothetical protein [Brucella anthropi]|uniref:hypothetical protein n=1 Tax=Brucella anthropi TaxID=529 RepID=UPI0024489812|nr:hypothetical protein [Brucella anthropi]MDH0369054.1 hypothetical protein [Brucella anthropi]